MRRFWMLLPLVAIGGIGCASTPYMPARSQLGELVLAYDDGFEMRTISRGEGPSDTPSLEVVARGYRWKALPEFVHCVPKAAAHAKEAKGFGTATTVYRSLAGGFAAGGLAGLGLGIADADRRWVWLGSGIGAAILGVIFGGMSRAAQNDANGNAIDAMNYYNDKVGRTGGRCAELFVSSPVAPR